MEGRKGDDSRQALAMKPNNIIKIPCSLGMSFFRYWMMFLKPFHNLTDREMDVAASLIRQRHELSGVIKDQGVLDRTLMGNDVRKNVLEDCNMSPQHFQVVMGNLRKKRVIVNGRLNPKFIPKLANGPANAFQLLLFFDIRQ